MAYGTCARTGWTSPARAATGSVSAFIAMFRRMTGTTPDKVRGQGLAAS
jgi:methylphosphotriester-DNA--protein-cysteine methyltransferase